MVKALIAFENKAKLKQKNFRVEIPMRQLAGLIQLKVGINGSADKYDFIFDSGADISAISKKLADSLHLKKITQISVSDAQHVTSKYDMVRINDLDLNGLHFYNLTAVVLDFGPNSVLNCLGNGGGIGVNIISACNWIIDFQANKLIATDSALHFPAQATSIPFKGRIPFIDAQVGNTMLHHVMVDLGSNESLTMPTVVLHDHPKMQLSNQIYREVDGNVTALNGAGLDTVYTCQCDSVIVGGKLYSHVTEASAPSYVLKIGTLFWNKNLMGLDYHSKHVQLLQRAKDEAQNPFHGFGFRVAMRDDKYVVTALYEKSPAANAGIKMGDEVEQLNGKPASDFFQRLL